MFLFNFAQQLIKNVAKIIKRMEKTTEKTTKKSVLCEDVSTLVSPLLDKKQRNEAICKDYAQVRMARPDMSDGLICAIIASRYGLGSGSIRYIVRKYSSTFNN